MDARALGLRNLTWGLFVELGRAPTAQEVAQAAEHPAPRSKLFGVTFIASTS
jgi:hypothetical protein